MAGFISKCFERPRPRDELKRERVLALLEENGIADGDFKVCLNINGKSL